MTIQRMTFQDKRGDTVDELAFCSKVCADDWLEGVERERFEVGAWPGKWETNFDVICAQCEVHMWHGLECSFDHDWQRARFTGTTMCSRCQLLPLDQEDIDTACPKGDCGYYMEGMSNGK